MYAILSGGGGTALVVVILAVIVCLIISSRIKAKKRGESGCGCKCSSCPSAGVCHANKKDEKTK